MTVKNQWGLLTGDGGDGFRVYSQNATPLRDSVVPEVILSQFSPLSVDLTIFPVRLTATNTPEQEEEESSEEETVKEEIVREPQLQINCREIIAHLIDSCT